MNPAVDRLLRDPLVRRSALVIVVLALLAVLLQGLAEQGGIGSALSPVPQQPLPFQRDRIFGLDLSDRPSLDAVQWVEAADVSDFGLVHLPVDADIISALLDATARANAFRALDAMMDATADTTVALCLERPVSQVEDPVLAELTVDTLRDRYPNRIAYVTSCDTSDDPGWGRAISDQLRSSFAATPGNLVSLSSGAEASIEPLDRLDDLSTESLRGFAGDRYVLVRVETFEPLRPADIDLAAGAIRDAAQIGLVLLRPDRDLNPSDLSQSIAGVSLGAGQLPEGFSGVTAPAIVFSEQWEPASVGRVTYRRTDAFGEVIRSVFVGTTIYLQALLTPDSGRVLVWIDPDLEEPGQPDADIDLSAAQARDAAVVLAEGLDADRHAIAIVTTGGEVTISGLFVSGQPEAGWNAALTTVALLLVGSAAAGVLGLARVQDIRDRTALPPADTPHPGHPRAFTRDDD